MSHKITYSDHKGPFAIMYLDDTDLFADEALNCLAENSKEAPVHSCNHCHKTFEDVDFPEERDHCLNIVDHRFDFPLEFCCLAHKRVFLISNVHGATCSNCNCRMVVNNLSHFAYKYDFYCSIRCFDSIYKFK